MQPSLVKTPILLKIHRRQLLFSSRWMFSSSTTDAGREQLIPLEPHVDTKWSYAYGKSTETLRYINLGQLFQERVGNSPDHLSYQFAGEDKAITISQLDLEVHRAMMFMLNTLGLSKGDRVAVFAYNCFRWLVIQCACIRLGITLVPINPSYKSWELWFVLQSAQIRCLFMPGPNSAQSRELNDHLEVLLAGYNQDSGLKHDLKHVVMMNLDKDDIYNFDSDNRFHPRNKSPAWRWNNWNELEVSSPIGLADQVTIDKVTDSVSPDDMFAIYYTSGTTGKPKGACISHFTAVNNLRMYQSMLRVGRPNDWMLRTVTTLPMFHIYNGLLISLAPLMSRSEVIMSRFRYDIAAYAQTLINSKANHTALTPTMLIDLLAHLERDRLLDQVRVRVISSGGASIAPEVVDRAHRLLPELEEVRIGYGSSENGGIVSFQSFSEPADTKRRSVGQPLPLTEVRIVDPKSQKVVPLGERGEIQSRGYNTMIGYLNEPEKTIEVLSPENRWYRSGDIGTMFQSGCIQVVTRIKQLIIKGGENVYPEEVEQMILRLEKLVEDCHVVGVPDRRLGEHICAWVKLKNPVSDESVVKQQILEHCKANITYFKVPKYVIITEEFPMTPTKKIQKHILTRQSIEILGLEAELEETTDSIKSQ